MIPMTREEKLKKLEVWKWEASLLSDYLRRNEFISGPPIAPVGSHYIIVNALIESAEIELVEK